MDKRPSRKTDHNDILDYYHSSVPDQGPFYQLARHSRQPSTTSSSSSEYSSTSDNREDTTNSDASSSLTRRSSVPSVGGADRRRIAIVEMEPVDEKSLTPSQGISHDPSRTLHARRGFQTDLSGLVIVAPPDAAPNSYALPSPPSTAPIFSTERQHKDSASNLTSAHQRSASEVLPFKKASPRDIGIVGTAQLTTGAKSVNRKIPNIQTQDSNMALRPPIFQQPRSASPSPLPSPSLDTTPSLAPVRGLRVMKRGKSKENSPTTSEPTSAVPSPLLTPEIGQRKGIHVPVAPPNVIELDGTLSDIVGGIRLVTQPPPEKAPAPVSTTTSTVLPSLVSLSPTSTQNPALSYVNYEPGLHSLAGPLPPPPRLPADALSSSPHNPPPRPPRLNTPLPPRSPARLKELESVKRALQLPPSVSAALAPKPEASLTPKSDIGSIAATAVVRSTSNSTSTSTSTMFSSPSFSETSSSSYSVLQPTFSDHRREGAFPPSEPDSGSCKGSELDVTEKHSVIAVPGGEDVPQVTIVSEPPLPSPILESPENDDDDDGEKNDNNNDLAVHHSRHHGGDDHGQTGTDGDEDSNENWVSISRTSSPSPHHDRWTSIDSNSYRRSVHSTAPNASPNGGNAASIDRESSRTPSELAPSPPPKNFRTSLTTGLKRFSSRSLPRTPSISSGSRRSSSVMSKRFSTGSGSMSNGGGMVDVSRTPSPSVYSAPLQEQGVGDGQVSGQAKPVRRKVVMQWPAAMYCNELHAGGGKKRMTSSERCAIYAQKINELYIYDCGLSEWVVEMKFRGPSSNTHTHGANKKYPDARAPASAPFKPQPRQISRSSVISDATFPTRPDASTATDLTPFCDDDGVYREDVPNLPYPSLATAQRAAASNVATTPPVSLRSLGSNSTLPLTNNGNGSTYPHAPASTLSHSSSTLYHATPAPPPSKHLPGSLSSGGGFFAALGRKASMSSSKKPSLGLGLSGLISSPISTSSSSSSGITSPSSGPRLLAKAAPGINGSGSKPVNVGGLQMNPSAPPSVVPGGPRAPPSANGANYNRVQRSKTFMPTSSSPFGGMGGGSNGGMSRHSPNSGFERRPSLWELQVGATSGSGPNTPTTPSHSRHPYAHPIQNYGQGGQGYPHEQYQQNQLPPQHQPRSHHHHHPQPQIQQQTYDLQTDPEFIRQVDKLADLLPNADRTVLAGYLRRAGQDVLAIGQYLEDEKNGTLKAY